MDKKNSPDFCLLKKTIAIYKKRGIYIYWWSFSKEKSVPFSFLEISGVWNPLSVPASSVLISSSLSFGLSSFDGSSSLQFKLDPILH